MLKPVFLLAAAIICAAPAAAPSSLKSGSPNPAFEVPIDCIPGKDCFIQQYFDHDPAQSVSDYNCGKQSYDGHDGTDIRLPSLANQRKGVNVLAAAGGLVTSVRSNMDDQIMTTAKAPEIAGRECGNGVVIDHDGGWTTQYCHMAKGSIVVAAGTRVVTGQTLGHVGLSGKTQFPHLHFAVRQGDIKFDPFSRNYSAPSCKSHTPLWSGKASASMAYREAEIINTGFAAGAVEMDDIEQQDITAPMQDSAALVFYARAIGLRAGDVFVLEIIRPDGSIMSDDKTVLQSDFAQRFGFAGKKRPQDGWQRGTYRASVIIQRSGKIIAAQNATLAI